MSKKPTLKVCQGCPDRFEGCVKLADDQTPPSLPRNPWSEELLQEMLTIRDGTVWRKVKLEVKDER